MLISKRRLKWSVLACLFASVLMLFQPTRSWLQRVLVTGLLGAEWSVAELILHSEHSIVEARNLSWQRKTGSRQFVFESKRSWFAIDGVGLVDRRFLLPKVVLQDARLELVELNTQTSKLPTPAWKQQLASLVSRVEWESVRKNLDSLTLTSEINLNWNQRIERWVNRSREIVEEANRLESQVVALNNPLRFEEVIRLKLAKLEELAVEQKLVAQQFESVDLQLEQETQKVVASLARDQVRLAELARTGDLEAQQRQICEQLAVAIAAELWNQLGPYAEVVNCVMESTAHESQPRYNTNTRFMRREMELLNVSEMKMRGHFESRVGRIPYSALGHWKKTVDSSSNIHQLLRWEFQFNSLEPIKVTAMQDTGSAEQIQIVLNFNHEHKPGMNSLSSGSSDSPTRLTLDSTRSELAGTLEIYADCASLLGDATADLLLAKETDSSSEECIRVGLSGDWEAPKFFALGELPVQLRASLKTEIDQQITRCTSAASTKLKFEVEGQLNRMRTSVAALRTAGQVQAAQFTTQLLATQSRLQQRFDSQIGTEFARRPGAVQR